jgi:hypothetical protein
MPTGKSDSLSQEGMTKHDHAKLFGNENCKLLCKTLYTVLLSHRPVMVNISSRPLLVPFDRNTIEHLSLSGHAPSVNVLARFRLRIKARSAVLQRRAQPKTFT